MANVAKVVRAGKSFLIPCLMALILITLASYYVLSLGTVSAVVGRQSYPTFGDDTYISMRFAQHLAQGHGLVWNVGEKPVEGYTNFLWTLWMAVLTLFRSDPSYLVLVSAALCHVGSVFLFYLFLMRNLKAHWFEATASAALLAWWAPIRAQALGGMEGPLLLLLLVAAMCFLLRDSNEKTIVAGSLVAGTLPLVRPDGLFLTVILLLALLLSRAVELGGPSSAKKWLIILGCLLGPLSLLTVFRLAYFGEWLPNTYYLKVVGRPERLVFGISYVVDFLKEFYGTPFLLPLLFYAALQCRGWPKAMPVGIVGLLAYVAYQGGDAWKWWRFFIPMLPMYLTVLALLSMECRNRKLHAIAAGIWLTNLVLGLWPVFQDLRKDRILPQPNKATTNNIMLGLALRTACAADAVIADFWAGAVPYYSGLTTIDMLGKSDPHIAKLPAHRARGIPGHDKFDFDYVIKRQPDVILSNHPLGVTPEELSRIKLGDYPFGAVLLEHEGFRKLYVPVESVLSNSWRGIYVRKGTDKFNQQELIAQELRLITRRLVVLFDDGWYQREGNANHWWRWCSGQGKLKVFAIEPMEVTMSFELASLETPNKADLCLNDSRVATLEITRTGFVYCEPIKLKLNQGLNIITLTSRKSGGFAPNDNRLLAVAVKDMQVHFKGEAVAFDCGSSK